MPASNRLNSDEAHTARGLRARLAAQDGLSLIEVAVSGLMVGLIALSLIGLDAAGKTTADQRRRAQAFGIAQADQERIKGLSADQIATLNQTRTVTLDGVAYTVTSTGQFLSASANSASCSSSAAAADYAKVISTVDWASNRRADIVVQSTITPRAGGALLAQTLDQNGNALPGVRINVAGADSSTDAVRRFGVTDSGGCTIFGTLLEGDYTVSPVLAGYVDRDGNADPLRDRDHDRGQHDHGPVLARPGGPGDRELQDHDRRDRPDGPGGAVGLLVQRRHALGDQRLSHPELARRLDHHPADAVPVLRHHARRPTRATTASGPAGAWPPSRRSPTGRWRPSARGPPGRWTARPGAPRWRCRGWSST